MAAGSAGGYEWEGEEKEGTKRTVGDWVCEVPPKARFEESKSRESLGIYRS